MASALVEETRLASFWRAQYVVFVVGGERGGDQTARSDQRAEVQRTQRAVANSEGKFGCARAHTPRNPLH